MPTLRATFVVILHQEKIKTLWSLATSGGEGCNAEAFLSKGDFLSMMVGASLQVRYRDIYDGVDAHRCAHLHHSFTLWVLRLDDRRAEVGVREI